ncbi:FIST N-terminal domain-containing protein [uncultured Methanolobus sp.]|uniref:FIST signal transduction protein n=1 Tax=uncultured Methanolobus sp. TaxID=218300 RepID=UPI0029C81F76|nr:FIST N-terminal domain-containing protein [uncultured Methanolobus sp.]
MNIIKAKSSNKTVKESVKEIKNIFVGFEPRMVLFFASSNYKPDEISAEMKIAFPNCEIIGCSTSGEIISGEMLKDSVVAMAFNSEVLNNVKIEVIQGISDGVDISSTFDSFESYYGEKMEEMDFRKYLGMVLVDGLTCAEESLMENIGNKTNVFFVGGSAGDDLKFEATHIFVNGKSYSNAAVLALMDVKSGFDIIKTQSFKVQNKVLVATKVNESAREIIEFNNEPAAIAYAKALDVPVDELSSHFMSNPLGLMIDNEPYVRSPQAVDGSRVKFYCSILEGMELSILESANIIEETANVLQQKVEEFGQISGLVNFNCILRTLDLESTGQSKEYAELFNDIPTAGFSTYGEQYLGHINQTATMIVFK